LLQLHGSVAAPSSTPTSHNLLLPASWHTLPRGFSWVWSQAAAAAAARQHYVTWPVEPCDAVLPVLLLPESSAVDATPTTLWQARAILAQAPVVAPAGSSDGQVVFGCAATGDEECFEAWNGRSVGGSAPSLTHLPVMPTVFLSPWHLRARIEACIDAAAQRAGLLLRTLCTPESSASPAPALAHSNSGWNSCIELAALLASDASRLESALATLLIEADSSAYALLEGIKDCSTEAVKQQRRAADAAAQAMQIQERRSAAVSNPGTYAEQTVHRGRAIATAASAELARTAMTAKSELFAACRAHARCAVTLCEAGRRAAGALSRFASTASTLVRTLMKSAAGHRAKKRGVVGVEMGGSAGAVGIEATVAVPSPLPEAWSALAKSRAFETCVKLRNDKPTAKALAEAMASAALSRTQSGGGEGLSSAALAGVIKQINAVPLCEAVDNLRTAQESITAAGRDAATTCTVRELVPFAVYDSPAEPTKPGSSESEPSEQSRTSAVPTSSVLRVTLCALQAAEAALAQWLSSSSGSDRFLALGQFDDPGLVAGVPPIPENLVSVSLPAWVAFQITAPGSSATASTVWGVDSGRSVELLALVSFSAAAPPLLPSVSAVTCAAPAIGGKACRPSRLAIQFPLLIRAALQHFRLR
jgi:hypothetical protein